jgi:hypothetical protein
MVDIIPFGVIHKRVGPIKCTHSAKRIAVKL